MKNITFDELVVKISAAHVVVDGVVEAALVDAAEMVKKTAEEKFGSYQNSIGNFPAWSALSSDYLSRKLAAGGSESPLIGVPSLNNVYDTPLHSTIEYTITPGTAHIGTFDPLGLWHEYGAVRARNTLSPRPFLRPALFQNEEKIVSDIKASITLALVNYFK